MKKTLVTIISLLALSLPANAGFKEHFDLGQQYLANYQYSGAITEFKSALRINYMDNSARIGLVNSYLARGTYYANTDKNYQKAANDYRSALFYLVYYPEQKAVQNSSQAIVQVTSNLNRCLSAIHFDTSAKNRFETAKALRADGDFAAAGYEFNQALGDRDYIKDSFEQVGDIMRLIGNDPKAAEYYKKAISVAPTDTALRLVYAKSLDAIGKENEAVDEYNFILSQTQDNDKDVLYSLERIYKKKLETTPNDANMTANLGAILQKQGKLDEALRYYSKAEYLDPANINTRINVGTLYQQKGDYKTAIIAYDSVLTLYPDNVQANLYKAQSQEALGDNKAAMETYKKVLAKDPDNEIANSQLLSTVRKSMSPQQFVEYAKKSQLDPNSIYTYALEMHKANKLPEAIYLYSEVLKLQPQNPEIYANLAVAYSQQQNFDAAINVLNNAKAQFPSNKQIADTLASINSQISDQKLSKAAEYYNNKDYKNAITEYLKIQPLKADVALAIASSYQNLNDNSNALLYYQKAFELDKNNSDIAYYIAALYAEESDIDNAQSYVNIALSINPNHAMAKELKSNLEQGQNAALLESAMNLYDSGKYDDSLSQLNQVLTKDPNNSYALYYRGMIYDSKKQYQNAINDYKKALAQNADLGIVNYLIAVDYDTLSQYKNAYIYYKTFVNSYAEDDDYRKYSQTRLEELKDYAK